MPIEYRNLAYTSPSGIRLQFDYDGVISDGVSHNLGEFQFAGVNDKYFQDRSISSDDYPFNILINDQIILRQIREAFSELVTPGNPGILEHPDPTIPSFPVVISGFKVDQNSVKGIGRIIVSVIFNRQIPDLIAGDPVESDNPASASATANKIDQLNSEQATDAENSVNQTTGSGTAAYITTSIETADDAKTILGPLAAKNDAINIRFLNEYSDIISNADALAREPFTLARKIQNLVQLPMLAVESVQDRIASYKEYVNQTLGINESQLADIDSGSPAGASLITAKSTAALAGISAINFSAVSGQSVNLDQVKAGDVSIDAVYLSRKQIRETIEDVQSTAFFATSILSELAARFGADSFFSQYFDYSILNKVLLTSTVRNLNNRIFSAVQERILVTDKEYHPVVLCGILYGSVELSTIDFFNSSNEIHGNELYLIPKGREIVYYG